MMELLTACGADLTSLAQLLRVIAEQVGGVKEALEGFALINALQAARAYLPVEVAEKKSFAPVLKSIAEFGGYEKAERELVKRVAPLHWSNMFTLANEILRVTTAGESKPSSNRNFGFFINNAESLHEMFAGITEAYENCMRIVRGMRLAGNLEDLRYANACDDPYHTTHKDARGQQGGSLPNHSTSYSTTHSTNNLLDLDAI